MGWSWIKPKWLIRREAARLLVRADADPNPANLELLNAWRRASPRNAEALAKAEAMLGIADLLQAPKPGAQMADAPGDRPPLRLGIAASVAAAAVLLPAAFLLLSGPRGGASLQAAMLRTGPGETRETTLADGSSVTLGGSTTIRVELSKDKRDATLEQGRATFRVARDPRPFRVRAGTQAAVLDEGVIDVAQIAGDQHMRVIKGSARVTDARGAGPASAAGPAVMIPSAQSVAGSRNRLSFDNARLGDVIAWANRGSPSPIMLADPGIARMRVSGVYGSGNPAGLAQGLADALGLKVRTRADGSFMLERVPRD